MMRVQIIETGVVAEYEDSYALRLVEQGTAILVGGDTPITPPEPAIDPSEFSDELIALKARCTALEAADVAADQRQTDAEVFAELYQSIAQAQERQLEYLEEHLQDEIDEMIE